MSKARTNVNKLEEVSQVELDYLAGVTSDVQDQFTSLAQDIDIVKVQVNVKEFGAVGDGVADDTAAVQNALNHANDVVFTRGTYLCTALTLTVAKRVILKSGATIKLKDSTNAVLLTITAASASVEGAGCLDGNKAGQSTGTAATVYINGVSYVRIDCEVKNARGSNIYYNNSTYPILGDRVKSHDATQYGLLVSNGSLRASVVGGEYYDNTLDGIFVTHGGATRSDFPRIVGCVVHGNGAGAGSYPSGIRINNCHGGTVQGVISNDHTYGAGIIIASADSSNFSKNITISGCVCETNLDGIVIDDYCQLVSLSGNQCNSNTQDGIDINDTLYCSSNGDVCDLNGEKGMLLWGARHFSVNGGFFTNNNTSRTASTDSGINVQQNATTLTHPSDGIIQGVTCRDDQGTPTQEYGIRLVNSADNIVVINNKLVGNKTGALNDATGSPENNPKKANIGYRTEAAGNAEITDGNSSVTVTTGIAATGVTLANVIATPNSAMGGRTLRVHTLTATQFTIELSSAASGSSIFVRWYAESFAHLD